MTEAEVRAAVLAALLEYEAHKKNLRLKTVKKALRGTVMATVIGSTGLMAANQGRSPRVQDGPSVVAAAVNTVAVNKKSAESRIEHLNIPGVAHFGLNQHGLLLTHKARLLKLTTHIPNDAEIFVIGRADALGGIAYNKKLAKSRALAVAQYLSGQGLKIKAITGKVSKQPDASWLARRVDIIVRHKASQSVSVDLPPIIDLYHDHLARSKSGFVPDGLVTSGSDSRGVSPQNKFDFHTGLNKQTPVKHQKISGVAHFAGQHAALTRAHKERLNELARQLPRNAKLTVIGRSNPLATNGDDHKISKLRALNVANYLASQGVKISATGVKAASKKYRDWMAHRVDVVVSHASSNMLGVKLSPLVDRPAKTKHLQKADYIAQKLSTSVKTQDVNKMGTASESASQWWDDNSKVNNSSLSKTSWSEPSSGDFTNRY